ncbi:MAG TPA: hypothetical protein VK832_02710 [Burkholderiaceae bacterium]|nr:hypothetical protein [Burkholderiaceae bacterium]
MMNNHDDDRPMTPIELRKELLITQGARYRSGILISKEKVVSGLRAETLARSVIKQIGLAAFAAWRDRSGLTGGGLPAILPLVIGGVSSLWRQPKLKPLIRGVVIAGTVASAYALFAKFKKTSESTTPEMP